MIWLFAACGPPTPPATSPTPALLAGPSVAHAPPDQDLYDGDTVTLTATAADEDGLAGMEVRFRPVGELFYERLELTPVGLPADDATVVEYTIDLPVQAPGIEYVLRAFDGSSYRIPGTWPQDAEQDPWRLDVTGFTPLAPFEEDFDTEDLAFGLFSLGWAEHALAWRGERWRLSGGASDTTGARHDDGYPGMPAVDDWLVAPTLDLSELATAEVRWLELGYGELETASHSVWLSTGDPDPARGDFVKVQGVPPPTQTGVWERAPVVDLSAWAGDPAVTLAWRYEGEGEGDQWRIDDVRVGEFRPDVSLREATVGRVEPGETVPVDLRFVNLGAPTASSILVDVTVPSGRGSFDGPVDLGVLANQQAAEPTFLLTVDPDHPDNTVLDGRITATTDEDTRSWPLPILVGDPTAGIVRLQVAEPGLVQVRVGVGEPALVDEVVHQGRLPSGVFTLAVDLGDHVDRLPAASGRGAWWASVESEGLAQLLGFGLQFDGQVTWSDATGAVQPGAVRRFHLPARAEPVVTGLGSSPSPLAPGSVGQLSLTLDNLGGPTDGPTALRIDGDSALGLGIDEVELPADWAGPTTVQIPVAVDPGHTDGSALDLDLLVVDGADAYALSTDVAVPWPSLLFGPPTVTDPTGNADGVVDPDEQVGVLLSVANDGSLTTGALTCGVQQVGGPTATITPSVDLPAIAPGASRAIELVLTATGAADGDTLAFELTCTDGPGSWAGPVQLAVGGVPWVSIGMDAAGDALAGASLDLREVRARVDGAVVQLEINGAAPVDAGTLDLEVWMDSPAGTWRNMVLTVASGQASLWGTQSGGWTPLADPTLTVAGNLVRVELPLTELGLAENTLQLGVGTGFCAVPELYCDAWPEGWGNPYDTTPNADDLAQFGW